MEKRYFDLAVIGAGPAGYTAAINAAQHGLSVALIEKESVGGTCLNVGCIPTKAMIESVYRFYQLGSLAQLGIQNKDAILDFNDLLNYRDKVVRQMTSGIEFLLKMNKVTLIKAQAKLLNPTTVQIDNNNIVESKNIIIATGSKTFCIKIEGASKEDILDSSGILALKEIPKSLLIVGGGAIGLEFGWIFAKLGSSVTIVEKMPNILPTEDAEATNKLKNILQKNGLSIFTSSTIERIDLRRARITDGGQVKEVEFDKLLVAVGRVANTENLGLEVLGIKLSNKKEVWVDDNLRTNIANIYACGDCIGNLQLAHVAYLEAEVAVKNILGESEKINYSGIPRCVYTHPEFAAVGINEEQAKASSDIKIGRFPFSANSKAQILGAAEGFVKIITDKKTDIILGSTIMGPSATELINTLALCIRMNLTTKQAASSIYGHPSLSEAIKEAMLNVDKRAIHIKN